MDSCDEELDPNDEDMDNCDNYMDGSDDYRDFDTEHNKPQLEDSVASTRFGPFLELRYIWLITCEIKIRLLRVGRGPLAF